MNEHHRKMQPLLIALGLFLAGLFVRAAIYFLSKYQQLHRDRINQTSRVLHLPQIQIPTEIPSIKTPVIEVPSIQTPSIEIPSIQELPTVELPSIHIPNIEMPHIEIPHFPDTSSTEPLLQSMHPDPASEKPQPPNPIELTPPPSTLQSPYVPENPDLIEKRNQRKNKIRNLFLGGEILD